MAPSATDPAGLGVAVENDDGTSLIGQVIDGRYRLDGILGSGGMGVVYRAAQVRLGRQVAVKILQPAIAASPDVRSRFEREVLAIGKIDHPNCVGVYDSGQLPDGSRFLAMELLDGRALAHVIEADGQLSPGRALRILAHILRGLGHVHAAGLVHRDIKPENIFLVTQNDDPEFAKILDFGIAKAMAASDLDDGVKLTQAGMAFGTPIYMAPEQALGNPLDGRADLYAAAVLAYEMLCGQPPFYSDDKLEVMSMHTARPVPPMRQRLVKNGQPVPAAIEKVIARGLTKRPADRYATAAAFLAEVEAALANVQAGDRQDTVVSTGAQPLVTETGSVRITRENDPLEAEPRAGDNPVDEIGDAIDDLLFETPRTAGGSAKVASSPGLPTFRPPAPTALSGFSGVGLGLPHTGPDGNPVFTARDSGEIIAPAPVPLPPSSGLPRAQSLGAVRLRPRFKLYAIIGGLAAIAIGVTIAVLTLPRGHSDADPSTPTGAASQALERGDPARAIQVLEAQKPATIHEDSQAQLVLGHAHAARHESAAALTAYARALELSPELESDAALRANLRAMADDQDAAIIASVFDLWLGHTHDDQARAAIVKAAVSETIERRKAVRAAIDRYKLGGSIDWLASYTFDLDQEVGCDHRKEAVAKLRALGDPRAVSALERAVIRRGKTGIYKNKPINACLVVDANAAITYLRDLAAASAPGSAAPPGTASAGSGSGQ